LIALDSLEAFALDRLTEDADPRLVLGPEWLAVAPLADDDDLDDRLVDASPR